MGRAEGSGTRLDRDRDALGRLIREHGQGGLDVAAAYADHLRALVLTNLAAVVEQLTSGQHWELCWNCDEHAAQELGLCLDCRERITWALPRRS